MITIKDFMETVDYRITEGSDFGWKCFGPNSYCLDSWSGEQDGYSIGITFDTKNQTFAQHLYFLLKSSQYFNKSALIFALYSSGKILT